MAKKQVAVQQDQAVVAAPQVVALRGGIAVAQVKLSGTPYRTKAVHNQNWWAVIVKAAATQPASVEQLIKDGIPSHFISYTLRRGYLADAAQQPTA